MNGDELTPRVGERTQVLQRLGGDPATEPGLRASDADRDVIREALNRAYAAGRISRDEHLDRLDHVASARTVGEVFQVADDVLTDRVPGGTLAPVHEAAPVARRGVKPAVMQTGKVWLFVAIITNAIWLLASHGRDYYWPIWPMFGTAIPVLAALIFGSRSDEHPGPRDEDGQRA